MITRRSAHNIILFCLIGVLVYSNTAEAYWIWTPETKKFVNPKYAVKDSPKEQYDWAMSFYNAKDFQRAATEFEKLAKQYEFSEYASKSQYYVGLCYENMQKYYLAFQNYQKALDNFPHISNMDEIIAREFAIGNIYLQKDSPKVLGTDIMAPLDRAVEIFKKVVENAPYGKHAEEAQFNLGEALKKSERYEEAIQAYHRLVDDYPNSKLAAKAMYEESYCAYKSSLKPAYDVGATDNAIKTFQKFVTKNKDADLAKEADATMRRLKDNIAEKSFKTAEFYESQGKKEAAIIYYQDVIDTYPNSSFVDKAKAKIEALKNPVSKKLPAPKKAEAPAKKQPGKKTWNPFSFIAKKEKPPADQTEPAAPGAEISKEEPAEAAVETPEEEPAAPAAEIPKEEPVVSTVDVPKQEPAVPAVERPKTGEAVPQVELMAATVEAPEEESAAVPVVETPKTEEVTSQAQETPKEKKTWKPFSFDAKKEPVIKEPVEKKPWKPFSFDNKKKPATPAQETPKEKKTWKPFSFDAKKEPVGKTSWKPLNFESEKERSEGWKPWNLNLKKKKEE